MTQRSDASDALVGRVWQMFQGDFSDFSEGWYRQVGSAIVTTMLLNLIMPHLGVIKAYVGAGLRKCYDRKCSFDKSITRKTTQKVGLTGRGDYRAS